MDIIPGQPEHEPRRWLTRGAAIFLAIALSATGLDVLRRKWEGDALALDGPAEEASPESSATPALDPSPAPSSYPGPAPEASPEPSPSRSPSPSPSTAPLPVPPPPPPSPPDQRAPAEPSTQFPALPANSGVGRRVVYSNSMQRVWLVEADGKIAHSWLVSGRRGSPRAGTFSVFSRSRHSSARGGRVRMEFMVRFARGRRLAIGFHAIPVGRNGPIQTEAQLGTFRSAGCVRQARPNAETLWNWAPIGTVVVVTP